MNARQVKLRALAKLNLDLRVLYRRPDGYHELRTIFQTISLADRITVRYQPSDYLQITMRGNVEIDNNLMIRAARLFSEETGTGGEIEFTLDKRIPMGAGLGGGSSDAAAVLLALPALTGRAVPPAHLARMAALLGSDVPFFLHGGTALGLGRGEELYPLPDRRLRRGLLIAPAVHVSTAEAYRALGAQLADTTAARKREEFSAVVWSGDLALTRNDFEDAVFSQHPRLAAVRLALAQAGAVCARMTGSGSALFGLFDDPETLSRVRQEWSGEPCFPISFVSRRRYRAMWARQLAPISPLETQ